MTPPSQDEQSRPVEEYFGNKGTGVEVEDDAPPITTDPEPWDPDKIRIHTKHYSLRQVVDMIAEGDIDLAPDFQRQYVWKNWQRWGLIESLLLGIPLPSFYLNEDITGKLQVVDGVQRLTTIFRFVHEKSFTLDKLTYLHELEGSGFEALDGVFKRRLAGSQFVAHVIDPQTPYRVKFDIFRRINTGGTPLSAQEIRHCMSGKRSRKFLAQLAATPSFEAATGGSLSAHPRMADREIALRFVAFKIFSVEDYMNHGGLDEFLGKAVEAIDQTLSDAELRTLENSFVKGMDHARLVFGEHAFRKWPINSQRRNPINRALVETWGTVLGSYDKSIVARGAIELVKRARQLMTTDQEFIDSIGGGTSDPAKVRQRFATVQATARGVLG